MGERTAPAPILHASCTEWRSPFTLEIHGRDGKLAIDGLGGSYGVERLAYYKMLPQMGSSETTIWEYPGEDRSWQVEWSQLKSAIAAGGQPTSGNLQDALAAIRVVDALYPRWNACDCRCDGLAGK